MRKLWTFGDSFTFGHGCKPFPNLHTPFFMEYSEYIDVNKPIWPEHVSTELNLDLFNYGINGATNELILDNTLDNISNFKKNDLIIIQMSTSVRYDFPFLKEKKILGGWENESQDNIYDQQNKSPHFFRTIFSANISKDYEDVGEDALTLRLGKTDKRNLKLTKEKYDLIKNFFVDFITTKKYYERQVWRFIKLSDFLISLGFNVYLLHEDYWPEMYEKPKYLISTSDEGWSKKVLKDKHTILHDTNGKIVDYHPSYDGHMSIAESILKFINENTTLYNT
jgi:hypothetical protein